MILSFTTHLDPYDSPVSVTASVHWEAGEPGSLSIPRHLAINSLSLRDPITCSHLCDPTDEQYACLRSAIEREAGTLW